MFFAGKSAEFLTALELSKQGLFYDSVTQAYLDVYGYNTPWDGDLPNGASIAADVNPGEDVNELPPDVAEARNKYFYVIRTVRCAAADFECQTDPRRSALLRGTTKTTVSRRKRRRNHSPSRLSSINANWNRARRL